MNFLRTTKLCSIVVAATLTSMFGLGDSAVAQHLSNQDGIEILTRGPVHEAFAETVAFDPEPGIVISQAPPDPIEEIAPNRRPEGPNVAWIPGYWGWDDERNDFVWISGIWRALPPGRQWIPGYWTQVQQGAQWISGYWADATLTEFEYLPEPPATIEAGPSAEATSADQIWLPGCWVWHQNRYAWRPGYWAQGNPDWDWVPAHYVWTPSGYVFVDGYYDYSVRSRGVVFAPVYFNNNLRRQRDYRYSPTAVINASALVRHLFLRPTYGHYYFGDYYGSNYTNAGFTPWFSYQSSREGYDPIYVSQRWQHRSDRDWEHQAEANYQHLRNDEKSRPPRSWAAQAELAKNAQASKQRNVAVASQLDELAQRKNARLRFQQVEAAEQQQSGQRGQEYRKYLQQRQQLEANTPRQPGANPATTIEPQRRGFGRSPFAAPAVDQFTGDQAPPQRHQVGEPDLQVQPHPKQRSNAAEARPDIKPRGAGRAPEQIQYDPSGRQKDVGKGNKRDPSGGKPDQQRGSGGNNGNKQGKANNKPDKKSKK